MSTTRGYTFRDAGLHSRVLRGANLVGGVLRRVGLRRPSLEPDALLQAARSQARLEDFGPNTLREPLEVLHDALEREAHLTSFGRMALRGMLVGALRNRLLLLDYAKRHPEVRDEVIEAPWIIVGLPRTGTTLLSLLLGLDPIVRPLEQWEASAPIPPPALATHREDPRIAECQRTLSQLLALNPAIRAMHPLGATLATECVTLLIFDLRSLSIETQAFVPSYGRWLEGTDMRTAYGMHELTLQCLQSRSPTQAWSLKTPNHLWCLDALLERYPSARILWTHRDPSKVVASVASLNCALQRTFSDRVDPKAVGADWDHKLHLAVERGLEFDERRQGGWCCHVPYADLVADPLTTLERIYGHFGDSLHPLHARRAKAWMEQRPQDAHGRHVYDPHDFGLRDEAIRERYARYRARFDVVDEV